MDRVFRIVNSAICSLDFAPLGLLRWPRGVVDWILAVVNSSSQGVIYLYLLIRLLLKKPLVKPTILDNFHPVSNLIFGEAG